MAVDNAKLNKLLELSRGDYKAFLYDCDGTLADNMQAHTDTYVRVAADNGVHINGDIIDELAGWPIPEVVKEINNRYGSSFDPDEFAALKHQLFYQEYINHIKPVEHVTDHLKTHAGKIKIGVVSGGSRPAIEKTLQVLGLDHLVDVVVCAGDTPKGKPHPDPFLLAAKKLGVQPQDCLVFEDGNPGVAAAKAAGMPWIRIDKV
jgi:HAD superfamily hydrolase (TIGR01509 family)